MRRGRTTVIAGAIVMAGIWALVLVALILESKGYR